MTKKEDTRPPTVTQEDLIISRIINIMENCDVANTNIPGIFLQTYMKYTVRVQLEGILSEMILNINLEK